MGKIIKNVLLSEYTTYKIGGKAKYFFIARKKEDLLDAVKIGKEHKVPIFIFGGGSNLLVSDKGFDGLAIKIDIPEINIESETISAGAGADLTKLAYLAADAGLSGLEWAAGIPGTVGGAIYGHAQAFGIKISDAVESVQAFNMRNMEFEEFTKEQCEFSLKDSIFKRDKNLVIISAVLRLSKGLPEEIKDKIKEFLEYRKNNHPISYASAGSTFVNPEMEITDKKLLEKYPELAQFNQEGVIRAGYLIEKSGLSGKKIGKAQISEKHSNFIINLGGAKAKDVISLMNLAKKEVKNIFGIELETEVQFVGFKNKKIL